MTGPSAVTGGVWKVRSIETLAGGLVGIATPDRYTSIDSPEGTLRLTR